MKNLIQITLSYFGKKYRYEGIIRRNKKIENRYLAF